MSLEPFLRASPVIQVHAAIAVLALLLGALQLFRKKGDWLHRRIGFTWVVLMAVVATSGLFIWTIRLFWLFSPIHLLSIFVLVMLWRGVRAARRGDIDRHQKTMRATYFFGLIITGLLTFIPGRTMYFVAFGREGANAEKLVTFAIVIAAAAAVALLLVRWRQTPRGRTFVASH